MTYQPSLLPMVWPEGWVCPDDGTPITEASQEVGTIIDMDPGNGRVVRAGCPTCHLALFYRWRT